MIKLKNIKGNGEFVLFIGFNRVKKERGNGVLQSGLNGCGQFFDDERNQSTTGLQQVNR